MNNTTQMRKPDGDSDRIWPGILWLAPVALAYFLVAHFSLSLIFKPEGITVIWPASGIFLSAVLLTRRKIRPYLVVVLFLTDFVSEMLAGTPLVASLVFSTALAGDAVLSAWLLFRYVGDPFTLRNVRQVAGFLLLSVILSNALAAVVAALIARIYLGTPFASWWFWWWSSDAVGNLLVTPVIISWAHAIRTRFDNFTILKSIERIISLVLMILLSEYAFSHFSGEHWQILLLNLVTFPFLIWAAMRFGVFGTSATSLLLAVIMIGNALAGRFSLSDYGPNLITLIAIQAYLGVMSVTALFLAATVIERQRTEVDLRENEKRYRYIADNASDLIWAMDLNFQFTYTSPSVRSHRGFSVEEAMSQPITEIMTPASLELAVQFLARMLKEAETTPPEQLQFASRTLESEILRKDGSSFWVESALKWLLDKNNKPIGILGVSRDITERRQAEGALRESEGRYRALFETSLEGIGISRGNQIINANRSLLDIFGFQDKKEFLRVPLLELVAPESREYIRELIKKNAGGQPTPEQHFEYQIIRKDGERRDLEISTVHVDIGEAFDTLSTFRDITERKKAEIAHRLSEERYRQLAEASQDMVFIISSDGTIEYINHVAAEKFKRKPEELIGKSQKVVFPAEVSNRQQSNLRIVFDSTQPRYIEEPTTFPDGDLWLGTWLVPLKDETGRIHSVMGVSRDITERRLAEEALQSSNAFNTLILQTIPFGMDIVDPDGKILFMNQVMEKAIGKPALGKRCWLSYRDDKKQCPDCPLKQTIDVGVTRTLESVGVMGGRTYEISHTGIIYRGEKAVMEIFYDVSGRKQTELEVRRQANEFSTLYETAQNLAGMTDLPTLLQTVLQRAVALLSTTNGTIALYDPQRGNLELRAVHNFPAPIGTRRELGEGMAGMVAKTRQPLVVDDYQKWVGHVPEYNAVKLNAAIEVPMIYHGDLVGTLGVGEVSSTRHFSENDVRLLSLFASLASAAVQNARLFSQTNIRLQHLSALRAIDMAISSSFDIHITLSILLDQVTKQLDVDAADVLILNQASQTLRFAAGQGFRTQALKHTDLRLGDGYAGQAVRDRQVIVIRDLTRNLGELTRSTEFSQEGFMTYIGVPLIAKGQVKGVMEILHREPMDLDPEQRAFVDMLGSQAAIAIDGSLIYENLQSTNAELIMAYDETIEGWAQAMDLRDKETEGHSLRVAEMAVRLAENLDTNLEDLIHIRRGALLHDIGKLGIPDEILLKAGPLTEEEWVSMRNHPEFANHMLAPIRYLRAAKEIPYCHHEKWNGTGYPRNLKGEQIPMAARIFAVVDVFDALTSDRPYRKAWSKEKALEHIRTSAGSHFDPQVVEAFLKLSQESG